jgi:hypothetical protein
MASSKALAWTERLAWILIYAGLFTLVLGVATLARSAATGWSLVTVGGLLAAGGVVLIWVRSRLDEIG